MASSRVFDPTRIGFSASADPSDIVWYDDDNEVSRVYPVNMRSRMPMVIWIDGACRGNGMPGARAAYGVYTGQDSCYNTSGCLPYNQRQTSQAAEIYAATHVAQVILEDMRWGVCNNGVVIVSDSDYLVRAITDYVYKWVNNGFMTASGRPVVNGDGIRELHDLISAWENCGAKIRFWKVPREHNQHADRLAKAVLA